MRGKNISGARGVCGRGAAGAASGTRGGGGGLAGSAARAAGPASGPGAECGAARGFGAGSATACIGCGCGEEGAPAPAPCRGGTAASADDFAIADGAAGAFGGTFAVVVAFAIGFAAGGDVATAALDGDDAPADDGSTATMALVSLGTITPNHDFGADFAPGFGPEACAIADGAGVFDTPFAADCAFATGFAGTFAFPGAAGGLAIAALAVATSA
jgi:hypothetical protein